MSEIINLKNFLRSTRDSGYRNLALALSELIDNSIEAGATLIEIELPKDSNRICDPCITVTDNGAGMEIESLAKALTFGGSTRFNCREGTGRFGMGLPNSSLSQAKRVEIISWTHPKAIAGYVLDIDRLLEMKRPRIEQLKPSSLDRAQTKSGTIVKWSNLDRATPKSWATESRKVIRQLGRIFRYPIGKGLSIHVNGIPVQCHDPLLVQTPYGSLAKSYGETLTVDATSLNLFGVQTQVEIRFTEVDVRQLADLPTSLKRTYGIVGGAGISIVRGDREIDYRWAFVSKRKENYDEWWRCEVRFDPCLDEAFGVTNTKQGIRPTEELKMLLTPQITEIAKSLNSRVRVAHAAVAEERRDPSEIAAKRICDVLAADRFGFHSRWTTPSTLALNSRALPDSSFLVTLDNQVTLNTSHPFGRVFYSNLVEGALTLTEIIQGVDLLLHALGKAQTDCTADLNTLLRLYFGGK